VILPALVTVILLAGAPAARPAAPRRAAPAPVRLKADGKGNLTVPAALVRSARLKKAENGTYCIEFPAVPLPPHAPPDEPVPRPPRVWVPARRDGSLLVVRFRVMPQDRLVPEAPGVVYEARGVDGRLVLKKVAPRRR
jgi:hypothetical protein